MNEHIMEPVCVTALRAQSRMGYGALELLDEELLDEELLVVVELPRHGNSGPSLVQVLVEVPPIVMALDRVELLDVVVELMLSHDDPGIWFTQVLEEDAEEPVIELVTIGVVVEVLVVTGPARVSK